MAPKDKGRGMDVEPLLSPGTPHSAPAVKYKKSSFAARWLVLFFSSFLLFGNYYVYDNPSALKAQLKDYFHGTQYVAPPPSMLSLEWHGAASPLV